MKDWRGLLCARFLMSAAVACALLAAPLSAHGRQPAAGPWNPSERPPRHEPRSGDARSNPETSAQTTGGATARAALSSRFVLEADLGLHLCTGVTCRDTEPFLGGRLSALLGFHANVAAGLHLAILGERVVVDAQDVAATTYNVLVGFDVRFRVPVKRAVIWAGLAMGYFRRHQPLTREGYSLHYTMFHGIGLGGGLGVDLLATESVAIGVSTWFYWAAFEGLSLSFLDLGVHWTANVGVRFYWSRPKAPKRPKPPVAPIRN